MSTIERNLQGLKERISRACSQVGRDGNEVVLLAVSMGIIILALVVITLVVKLIVRRRHRKWLETASESKVKHVAGSVVSFKKVGTVVILIREL